MIILLMIINTYILTPVFFLNSISILTHKSYESIDKKQHLFHIFLEIFLLRIESSKVARHVISHLFEPIIKTP